MVTALQALAKMRYPDRTMVEYGHPEPIGLYYPQEVMTHRPDGLASLREVAMPEKKLREKMRFEAIPPSSISMERPLRHMGN